MATSDHKSSLSLGVGASPDGSVSPGQSPMGPAETVWLDGDVLACTCPDCGGPMSIRLWLGVADCWRCGSSIELSEEQEQEALRLLREREEPRRAQPQEAIAATRPAAADQPTARPESPTAAPKPQPAPKPATVSPRQVAQQPRRVATTEAQHGARARVRDLQTKGTIGVLWSNLSGDLPAWLISLVLHLVAMLLLGLWADRAEHDTRPITLSTNVGYEDLEGAIEDVPLEGPEFEAPGAIDLDELTEVIQSPGRPEPQLEEGMSMDPPDPLGDHPLTITQLTLGGPPAVAGRMFAGRDPELRSTILRREGGTSLTEAAVARGLAFLSRHQNQDGSWSLHAFHRSPACNGQCTGAGGVTSDTAGTALALLPFLGAGQTHLQGLYAEAITKGLKWLVEHQGEDGDLQGAGGGRMYAHGLATIVLCEALHLSRDEQLRGPAQSALDFVVRAQHYEGGWRYRPGEPGDTSVVGWQLMALQSGKAAQLYLSPEPFKLAGHYLDRAQTDKIGSRYAYQPNGRPTHVMTAEALLCRQYLGWPRTHRGLRAGVKYLLEKHPPDARTPNVYYWYYATQVMHHIGGKSWYRWNLRMRQVLTETQETRGHQAGSWAPRGNFSSQGGRIFMTSLAVCTLEVYYRHLSLYREDHLEKAE